MKASGECELWQVRPTAAFTPAVILFIAFQRRDGKPVENWSRTRLDQIPRRCPRCRRDTIVGHGQRQRQAHDQQHDWIRVRRGECRQCHQTFTFLPDACLPYSHYSLHCRCEALELYQCLGSAEAAMPIVKEPDRVPDPSTIRRWRKQWDSIQNWFNEQSRTIEPCSRSLLTTILAWVWGRQQCILPATDSSP